MNTITIAPTPSSAPFELRCEFCNRYSDAESLTISGGALVCVDVDACLAAEQRDELPILDGEFVVVDEMTEDDEASMRDCSGDCSREKPCANCAPEPKPTGARRRLQKAGW